MPCSRCGQSRPARPNPPSGAGRPGTSWNPARGGASKPGNTGTVKDAITGLKYVPSSK